MDGKQGKRNRRGGVVAEGVDHGGADNLQCVKLWCPGLKLRE